MIDDRCPCGKWKGGNCPECNAKGTPFRLNADGTLQTIGTPKVSDEIFALLNKVRAREIDPRQATGIIARFVISLFKAHDEQETSETPPRCTCPHGGPSSPDCPRVQWDAKQRPDEATQGYATEESMAEDRKRILAHDFDEPGSVTSRSEPCERCGTHTPKPGRTHAIDAEGEVYRCWDDADDRRRDDVNKVLRRHLDECWNHMWGFPLEELGADLERLLSDAKRNALSSVLVDDAKDLVIAGLSSQVENLTASIRQLMSEREKTLR